MASKHNATFLDLGFTLICKAHLLRLEYIRIEMNPKIMIYTNPHLNQLLRNLRLALCLVLVIAGLQACSVLQIETYAPKRGQMGKDVMWLPTSDDLMFKLLEVAKVGPKDELVDLGAGDGKIPIAAARQFGAQAWGIEYNKDLAALAQRNAQRAGVADRVRIVHGDIFKEDFSKATVVTLYLLEELNAQLRPTILDMKPGTRVLSNTFSMGDWEPDEVISVTNGTGYFWTVPAKVAGLWTLSGLDEKSTATLKLDQAFQRVGGSLTLQGKTQNVMGARIEGAMLHFSFVNADGLLKAVKVLVNGNALSGQVTGPYGMVDIQPQPVKVEGRRP